MQWIFVLKVRLGELVYLAIETEAQ